MNYLPIFFDIKNKPCIVVGGGGIAARKVDLLRKAQADVTVISPELGQEMTVFHGDNKINWIQREYQQGDLAEAWLVVAATHIKEINQQVSTEAESLKIPCNVVDNPDICSFIMPSIIDRDPVQIAISTGGASPVLARLIRTNLESCTPSAYGKLAHLVSGYRESVKNAFPKVDERRKFWESILEGPVSEHVFAGRNDDARQLLEKLIAEAKSDPDYIGEVFLVGAGPGDPDLLTFRALRLMQKADVIVYDRLVSEPIMDLVRRDAERIYAGKERSKHAIPQENINQLLVRLEAG